MKEIAALIVALPQILELIRNIQKRLDEKETEKKVKDDLAAINQAFKDKDAKHLNDIFNS